MMETNRDERQGCFGLIIRFFQRSKPTTTKERQLLPYRLTDQFLSPSELSYFRILRAVLGSEAAICAKIRLADLLFVSTKDNYISHFNRLAPRHIDFLVCEASTMQPLLAIELDDSSHRRTKRQDRDRFLDEAFAAANFPLLRVPAQPQYRQQQVIDQLEPFLSQPGSTQVEQTIAQPSKPEEASSDEIMGIPNCPKCGIPMVLRMATKGKYKGKRFYGCANYPQCKEVLPAPEEHPRA
jgi:hypothetical protein